MENIPVRKYRTRSESQKYREEAMAKKREKLQKKLLILSGSFYIISSDKGKRTHWYIIFWAYYYKIGQKKLKEKYQNDEDFRNKRSDEIKGRYKSNCNEHQQLLQFKEKVMNLIGETGVEKIITIA